MQTLEYKFAPGSEIVHPTNPLIAYRVESIVLDPTPKYELSLRAQSVEQALVLDGSPNLFKSLDYVDREFIYSYPKKTFSPDVDDWNAVVEYIIKQLDKVRGSKKKVDRATFAAYNDIISLMADIEESQLGPENHEFDGAQLAVFHNVMSGN